MLKSLKSACAGIALAAALATGANAAEKIVLGIPVTPITVQFAYFAFGEELGFFAEEGIEVEYSAVNGTGVLLPQVAAGQVDLGLANPDLTLVAAAKGEPLPITFVMNWLRSHGYEFVTLENSPITDISQIKGRKFGVGGLTWGNLPMSRAILKEVGIDWDKDIEVLPVGMGPAAWRRLETGEIDVLNLFISQHALMELAGIRINRLELPAQYRVIFSNGLAAGNAALESKPELIAGFGRALSKSWVACKANVEACVRAHWKRYPAEQPAPDKEAEQLATDMQRAMFDARMIDDFGGDPDPQFGSYSEDIWRRYVDVMAEAGQIASRDVDLSRMFTNRFVPEFNRFDRAAVAAKAKAAQ